MNIEDKYMPTLGEQKFSLETRISENKKQYFGGYLEIKTGEAIGDKNRVDQAEYMMKQIAKNIDTYTEILDNLE